jgi:rRNA-processing protein FCF1
MCLQLDIYRWGTDVHVIKVLEDTWFVIQLGQVRSTLKKARRVAGVRHSDVTVKGRKMRLRSVFLAEELERVGVKTAEDIMMKDADSAPQQLPVNRELRRAKNRETLADMRDEDGEGSAPPLEGLPSLPLDGKGKGREVSTPTASEDESVVTQHEPTIDTGVFDLGEIEKQVIVREMEKMVGARYRGFMRDEDYLELADFVVDYCITVKTDKGQAVSCYLGKKFPHIKSARSLMKEKKRAKEQREAGERRHSEAIEFYKQRERERAARQREHELNLEKSIEVWAQNEDVSTWATPGASDRTLELEDEEGKCFLRLFIRPNRQLRELVNPTFREIRENYNGEAINDLAFLKVVGRNNGKTQLHVEYNSWGGDLWDGVPLKEILRGGFAGENDYMVGISRHGQCTDVTCTEHLRIRDKKFRIGRTCPGGVKKFENLQTHKCHLCVPDVDKNDPNQIDCYIDGPASLIMPPIPVTADMESFVKPLYEKMKHKHCIDPLCEEHVNPVNLCWSGSPCRWDGICHLCLEVEIPRVLRCKLDDQRFSRLTRNRNATDGNSKCTAILAAGRMLHRGDLPSSFVVSMSLAESRVVTGCGLCGEDTGNELFSVKVCVEVEGHLFISYEAICRLCKDKSPRLNESSWWISPVDLLPATAVPKGIFVGDLRGDGPYRVGTLGEGISLRRTAYFNAGDSFDVAAMDLIEKEIRVMVYGGGGVILKAPISDGSSFLSQSATTPVLVDTSVFGNIIFAGRIDVVASYVITDTVINEAVRTLANNSARMSDFVFFLKYQNPTYFVTTGRGDTDILAVAFNNSFHLMTYDMDLRKMASERGVPLINTWVATTIPRGIGDTWALEMGANSLGVENGRMVVVTISEEEMKVRNFFGIKEKKLDENLTIIPELERAPLLPAALPPPIHLDWSGRSAKLLVRAAGPIADLREVFNWASQNVNRLSGPDGLLQALKEIEDLSQVGMPPGYRKQRIDSMYPLTDLTVPEEEEFFWITQDIVRETSIGVERPDWDGKRDYLRSKEGLKSQKPWDEEDIQLSLYEGFEAADKKGFTIEDPRFVECTPLKRALLGESSNRKFVDYPSLLKFSRLCYHLLNLMKGKALVRSQGKTMKFSSQIARKKTSSNNQCYVSDFGFKNMGVVVYRVPGRFVESEHFDFRFYFVTSAPHHEGFHPHKTITGVAGNYCHFTNAMSLPAHKLAHMANLYLNSTGLRNMGLDSGKYAFWYFYNFFTSSRIRKDVSMIKFFTTISLSDYNTMPGLIQKYLKGPRRRPIERLSLRIWEDVLSRCIVQHLEKRSEFLGISYMGTTKDIVSYVDLGNLHVMSSVNGETHNHLMNEAIVDLSGSARNLPNIWEDPPDFPIEGRKTWSPSLIKHSVLIYLKRSDLKRDWLDAPMNYTELLTLLDADRDRFFRGPKSSYHFIRPSAFTNTIAHAKLVEAVIAAGGNDCPEDIISFSVGFTRKVGYCVAFQGIKPQHDASARAIVIQTSVAKVLNWVHQVVFRCFNEQSPTELTSKPVIEQQNIVQQTSSAARGLLINDDMGKWSGSDFKEKFRFVACCLWVGGAITTEVRDLLLLTMELSDQIRICVPAIHAEGTGAQRVWLRRDLNNILQTQDSFNIDDPEMLNPWSERPAHQGVRGVDISATSGLLLDPRTGLPTKRSDWFVVITMKNGWMQGLFHSASSFVHDLEMGTYKEMIFMCLLTVVIYFLVHSDDKNVTVSSKLPLTKEQCEIILNCNTNLPRLFGLEQSGTKFSAIRQHSLGDFEVMKSWVFSEFLGSFSMEGLAYSSASRQWGVMNACTHDNPVENVLALISSHITLINHGEDPVLAEVSLHQSILEVERRFGLKRLGDAATSDIPISGLDPELLLDFLGFPCASVIEFRNFGTSVDKLWKLMRSGGRACGQMIDLPSFITRKHLRKKLQREIDRLREEHTRYEDRLWGEAYTLSEIEGRSTMSEAGLGILAMGIGVRAARWRYMEETVNAETMQRRALTQGNVSQRLDNRMAINLLPDDIREISAVFQSPSVEFSAPERRFFGFGDLVSRNFDITVDHKIVQVILEHGGLVNPAWSSKFNQILRQLTGFRRLYSVEHLEDFILKRGLWEMHRINNSFRHTISNMFQGKWDFKHVGLSVKMRLTSATDTRLLPYVSRTTVDSLTNNPRNLFLRVQNEVNVCLSQLLTSNTSSTINMGRRVRELGRSFPLHPGVSVRGVGRTANSMINVAFGSEFQLSKSSLRYEGQIDGGLVYSHILFDIEVNFVFVDTEIHYWVTQVNLATTRALVEERWPGFAEGDAPYFHDELKPAWGKESLILSKRVNGSVVSGRSTKYEKGVVIINLSRQLPGAVDISHSVGLYLKTTTLGYHVQRVPKALALCNGRHGPNLWHYKKDIEIAVEASGVEQCSGWSNCPDHFHFCRVTNTFTDPSSEVLDPYTIEKMLVLEHELSEGEAYELVQNTTSAIKKSLTLESRDSAIIDSLLQCFGYPSFMAMANLLATLDPDTEVLGFNPLTGSFKIKEASDGRVTTLPLLDAVVWNVTSWNSSECLFVDQELSLPWDALEFEFLDLVDRGEIDQARGHGGCNNRTLTALLEGYVDVTTAEASRDWRLLKEDQIRDLSQIVPSGTDDSLACAIEFLEKLTITSTEITHHGLLVPPRQASRGGENLQLYSSTDRINTRFWELVVNCDRVTHNLPFCNAIRKRLSNPAKGTPSKRTLKHLDIYEEMAFALLLASEPLEAISLVAKHKGKQSHFSRRVSGLLGITRHEERFEADSILFDIEAYAQELSDAMGSLILTRTTRIFADPRSNHLATAFLRQPPSLPSLSRAWGVLLVPVSSGANTTTAREISLKLSIFRREWVKAPDGEQPVSTIRDSLMKPMDMRLTAGFFDALLAETDSREDFVAAVQMGRRWSPSAVTALRGCLVSRLPRLSSVDLVPKSVANYLAPLGISLKEESHFRRPLKDNEYLLDPSLPKHQQLHHPCISIDFDGSSEMEELRNLIAFTPGIRFQETVREEFHDLQASCTLRPNRPPRGIKADVKSLRNLVSGPLYRQLCELLSG